MTMPWNCCLALLLSLIAFSGVAATPRARLHAPAAADLNGIEVLGKADTRRERSELV